MIIRTDRLSSTVGASRCWDWAQEVNHGRGRHAAPNEVAGGVNVFDDLEDGWGSVGWEAVVQAEPEVIVVVDYAGQPAEDKIAFLKSALQLANTPAVRDGIFHVISYGDMVSGPRNAQGAESLGAYLRSIGR